MGSVKFTVCGMLVLLCFTSANAQKIVEVPTPAPAPAPAPDHVNLTKLLSVAGPFFTFLNYLKTTKLIDDFQTQANNTEEGITIFVPRDSAFSSLKNPSLANLTHDQLRSLFQYHAIPHYYALADFKDLNQLPIPTFAGGQYTLNVTDNSGTVHINTGWTQTKIISAVLSTHPVAVYETDRVLLPEAIFGTDIPPMPAPAPAPVIAPSPVADQQADHSGGRDSASPSHSSSERVLGLGYLSHLVLAVAGGIVLFW